MQPANYPLDIYRGDSASWQFKLWADSEMTSPVDLTGVTPKAEIRDRPAGTQIVPLLCTLTLPNIIDVTLTAAASKLLPIAGVWDLQLSYVSGDVRTPISGQVTITSDVTDSTPGEFEFIATPVK
jgi:hypothetical protein